MGCLLLIYGTYLNVCNIDYMMNTRDGCSIRFGHSSNVFYKHPCDDIYSEMKRKIDDKTYGLGLVGMPENYLMEKALAKREGE